MSLEIKPTSDEVLESAFFFCFGYVKANLRLMCPLEGNDVVI